MLAAIIILSWVLITSLACLLATNKDLTVSKIEAAKLRDRYNQVIREKELAVQKTEMLLEHVNSDREYIEFDSILSKLPLDSRGYPYQFEVLQGTSLRMAALNFCSEDIPDEISLTKLAFNAERLWLNQKEWTGWSRSGWVLIPEKALKY